MRPSDFNRTDLTFTVEEGRKGLDIRRDGVEVPVRDADEGTSGSSRRDFEDKGSVPSKSRARHQFGADILCFEAS